MPDTQTLAADGRAVRADRHRPRISRSCRPPIGACWRSWSRRRRSSTRLFLRQVWAGNEAMLLDLARDQIARGPRAAALLPDQQGTVVAARSRRSRSCRARRPSRPAPTSIRTARRRRISSAGSSRCPRPNARARPASSPSIRRAGSAFTLVPYNVEYQAELARAAALLREAAQLTDRADAEGVSHEARRRVPVERLLRERRRLDGAEGRASSRPSGRTRCTKTSCSTTRRRSRRSSPCRTRPRPRSCRSSPAELQDIEDHLPIDPKQRNPKLGALAPIVVVNEIFAAGDANRGVQTAAFNLPNDERVVREKGAKRVMLKNVQDAKFAKTLVPISKIVLSPADQKDAVVRRLLHAHRRARADARPRAAQHHRQRPADDGAAGDEGDLQRARGSQGRHLGPVRHPVHDRQGRAAEVARARRSTRRILASAFRSIRFGVNEAHGRGIADPAELPARSAAASCVNGDGTFAVEPGPDQGRRRPA